MYGVYCRTAVAPANARGARVIKAARLVFITPRKDGFGQLFSDMGKIRVLLLVSCVVLGPPAGHRTVVVLALCRCPLLVFFPSVFFSLSGVGPSTGHTVEVMVPANSNLAPSGLGLGAHVSFIYFVCITFISVPGNRWLQVTRSGKPRLFGTVPSTAHIILHVSGTRFVASRRFFA